ncbi:DUF4440 domain-containing protein [Vibrio neptunius]|uniref:nuclear transport factor 2 family protein n=1 Tax=Vibrio neptunius TaxID=170651 RepID=UPI0019D2B74A|nr:DUF4440 domain-containing protein [Vibrio neptunius]MBN3574563.1 DUF4440 domain-containing protein [Vibrio neptunius]QXX08047.1 DUF4440 domain-containing protein [Vibrio neptunius]
MEFLIEQEVLLQQYEVRHNESEVVRLLHPDFVEVGRSGKSFDLKSILEMMKGETPSIGKIHSQSFECVALEPSVQLLMYKSVWIDANGNASLFTKRASIWVFTGEKWQLKYHQGTPCEPFRIEEARTS